MDVPYTPCGLKWTVLLGSEDWRGDFTTNSCRTGARRPEAASAGPASGEAQLETQDHDPLGKGQVWESQPGGSCRPGEAHAC